MSSKFYPSFIPIYGYMVSGVRIKLPGASVLTPYIKLHLTNAEVGMWNAEGRSRCALSFLKIDRIHHFDIHYSIFAFSKFLFRSDWTLAARGADHMKLHFKSWSWFHPGPLCLCRLG